MPNQTERTKKRAAKANLVYVNSLDEGITRQRCGRGFTYRLPSGKTLKSQQIRRRIEALVIPPAWNEVRICPRADGHLQAVGYDDAGRKQYLYHPRWQAISSAAKLDRLHRFGELLPKVRRRIRKDLNRKRMSRQRILAVVVRLLDKAHLRIGNRTYAQTNGAYGATTLLPEHVQVEKTRVRLQFPGKSGQSREVALADAKVATIVRGCEEIDGQFLFQYLDRDEQPHQVNSGDVNAYLQDISNETITAKDFRTWWGSVIAMAELENISDEETQAGRKRVISQALDAAASELGNTKAVCRSSYVHPGLLAAAETGEWVRSSARLPTDSKSEMTLAETRFLAILPSLDFT